MRESFWRETPLPSPIFSISLLPAHQKVSGPFKGIFHAIFGNVADGWDLDHSWFEQTASCHSLTKTNESNHNLKQQNNQKHTKVILSVNYLFRLNNTQYMIKISAEI